MNQNIETEKNNQGGTGTEIIKAGSVEDIKRLAQTKGAELAKMTVAVHLSSSTSTLEEALAEFYKYGSQIPFLYSDGSIATALKEIYNQYNETVNERIPGVTGVNSVNAYLIRYMTESLPSLCENGRISQRLIDDLVAPHGIISYMLKELFSNHLKTIEKINDAFLVRTQLPNADKESIKSEKEEVLKNYQDEFDKHIEKIKQIFLHSDAQFIYTTLLGVSQKLSSGEIDLSFSGKPEETHSPEKYPEGNEEISSLLEGQAMAMEKMQERVEEKMDASLLAYQEKIETLEKQIVSRINEVFSSAASSAAENTQTEEPVSNRDLEAMKEAQAEMFSKMNTFMENLSIENTSPHTELPAGENSVMEEMRGEISSLKEQLNGMASTISEMAMSVQEMSVSVPASIPQEHVSSANPSEEEIALLEEIKERVNNNTLTLGDIQQMISDEVAESQRVRETLMGTQQTEASSSGYNNTEVQSSDEVNI